MCETLIKDVALCGLPKAVEATIAIDKAVMEADLMIHSAVKVGCVKGATVRVPGPAGRDICAEHGCRDRIVQEAHDFEFWAVEICYGLHLSDRQILDDVDTHLVVLGVIMGQDLPRETHWHMRGLRRVGISKEDVQMVCDCVHNVARFCCLELDRIPPVELWKASCNHTKKHGIPSPV